MLWRDQKLRRQDLGRDEFLKLVWKWKEEYVIPKFFVTVFIVIVSFKDNFKVAQEIDE